MDTDARRERRIAWSARAGVWLIRLLGWTWRIRVTHDADVRRLRAAKQPIIFTVWHGQLLPCLYHHRGEQVAVLISEHADGEIIARIAESLGYRTVRGSTSRGAARALLGLARAVNEGHDLAITPDGPRGPAKSIAKGSPVVVATHGCADDCRGGVYVMGVATQELGRVPHSADRLRESSSRTATRCTAQRPTRARRPRMRRRISCAARWTTRRRGPVDDRGLAERVWYGGDALASSVRTALIPAERIFGGLVGARDILYDAGWLPALETPIPAVSVGNLTVGGTGKTPMAAWIARGLAARGAQPAVVLRGYGDDEPLVHRALNPDIPVIVGADRVAAVAQAAAAGATVAVLDDAFQHRRVQRLADIVLISADRWTGDVRLLPAGPWREPLESVRRATLVVVTRKAASDLRVGEVHEQLARIAPAIPRVSVRLAPGDLVAGRRIR